MFGDGLRDLLDPRLRGGIGRYSLSEKRLKQLKESVAKKTIITGYNSEMKSPSLNGGAFLWH